MRLKKKSCTFYYIRQTFHIRSDNRFSRSHTFYYR